MVDVVGECYWCSIGIALTQDGSIDHLVPVSKGGTSDLTNIVLSCHTCNNAKKDKEAVNWGSRLVHWAIRYIRDRDMELNWKRVRDLLKGRVDKNNKRPIGEGVIKEVLRRPESKAVAVLRERYSPNQTPFQPMDIAHGYDKHILKLLIKAREEGVVIRTTNNRKEVPRPSLENIWPKAS